MNIGEKLALSERQGKITLLREGLFLRCYEQSLYSLVTSVYPALNVLSRAFKNLSGRRVFYGGFPESQLIKLLPEATQTAWGYECNCADVCGEAYLIWSEGVMQQTLIDKKESKEDGININLDIEHCRFLASWQPRAFPADVDAGFIASLKKIAGI